ncbi:SEC14-like protein 2 isoform X2 [Argiope bruennichi]|uniref:SEC14-like protein 2 isoform X2 n=1 Tax=Argiope bruennichi TaxID=94029 RepID=UPI0024942CCE|nr:SEC14-like protein 2 isoform X2 [Argiope bruennichi]
MTRGDINADEQRYVDKLRKRLKGKMSEEMFTDDLLLRFLRARSFNIEATEDMLLKHQQWRKRSKIDTLLTDYKAPEVFEKYFPLNFMCYDKDGCSVTYCAYGNLDVKGLAKCSKKSEFLHFFLHHLEEDTQKLKSQSEKLGKKVEKWSYIFNYEHFSLASATDRRTSFYFTILWAVLKPFFSAETNRKIKIFGKEGWQEELKKEIGADNLPAFLGGNVTDPDGNPMCNSFIKHGGLIPEKYYVQRDRKSFSKLPGVKKLVVNRRSKENVKLEVQQSGSHIEWDFDVKNKDISYTLIYEDPEKEAEDGEEILPKQRVDTILESESGVVKCEKPGTYILQFDNSYSWIHNKVIYYQASVVNPNDVIDEDKD